MRNPLLFFSDLARQPLWISIWVTILAVANIASLLFWPAPLAKVIFITFMLSAMTMMALYSYLGFAKILGMGHVFWIVLLPYILLQIGQVDGGFFVYLVTLAVLLSISLVFDAMDVWKYFHRLRATW
jgi:hypothetical protein